MLELWNVYNVAFYFGSIILTAALLFLAWKSTHVPEQHNITVVVWQHPSGRQTLQRFATSSRNINPDHHNEQYGQITFGSSGVEDITEMDSDEDISVGRILNIVQEAVQATNVALHDAQESNILPSSVPLSDTGNHHLFLRPPTMEPTTTTQLSSLQSINSNDSPQATSLSAISSSASGSTNAQSVRPKSYTGLNKVVENSDTSPSSSSLDSSKELDAECISSSSCLENHSKEHSHSKVLTTSFEPTAACSSSNDCGTSLVSNAHTRQSFKVEMGEIGSEIETPVQQPPDNIDAIGTSTCRNADANHVVLTGEEASKPMIQRCKIPSSTKLENELQTEATPDLKVLGSKIVSAEFSNPAPGTDNIEGLIRIRLKFIDDQQKTVQGILTQNVLCFKRKHFNTELSERRVVRLIFNGRLLKQDDSTLAEYGLYDNCVVHCHVSQPKPPPAVPPSATAIPGQTAARQGGPARRLLDMFRNATATEALDADDPAEEGLNISNYLSGLLWLVVAGLWVARLKHSYMFSSFSTFMLVFLTLLLIVPHYLFSVDVQLDLSLDTRTLRNLGIDRVLVLQRRQIGEERQPSDQDGDQPEAGQDGPRVQQAEAASQPTSLMNPGNHPSDANVQQDTNVADGTFSRGGADGSTSTVTSSGSSGVTVAGAVTSDPSGARPPVDTSESSGGARRRHVL